MSIQVVPTYLQMLSMFIGTYLLSPYGHNMDNYGEMEGGHIMRPLCFTIHTSFCILANSHDRIL
jgi:hypothetical protein